MSCNPVSESLLFLWRAEAFSACTWFLDPKSLGRLRGYGESGILMRTAIGLMDGTALMVIGVSSVIPRHTSSGVQRFLRWQLMK